ncbi:MAG: minichromosome maintenance protein MCM [Candidatus Thermoplasmatota archaeon]|jgi:replicative DNA helicase Mcm|nr:minichromosome maintenance protein MCM [Candidatus Thermoplasmatota archaeon]MCL5791350.1 minichromosome maintenance protein MCM [Candidatus Thermoplasmatota archaeon]
MYRDDLLEEQRKYYEPEELRKLWDHLFQQYGYYDSITRMSSHYPEERSLYVSFDDIDKFDPRFSLYLLQNAEETLNEGNKLLREYIASSTPNFTAKDPNSIIVNIRITSLPETSDVKVEIRNLRSINVGKLISITGIIRKNTEVMPRLYNAAFQCVYCRAITYMLQQRGRLEEPEICSNDDCPNEKNKPKFNLLVNESRFIDTQKIEIQENPENINGGAQPLRLTVISEDDIAGKLFPGDRVSFDGILKAEQKVYGGNLLTEFSTFLYTVNYRKTTKEMEEINISPAEEEEILKLSKDPAIVDKLAGSIAPSIYGLEHIKKTLALQMFGGVRKTMKDGTTIRGDIHILMVGDPGTAKSQLLRYMSEISPRGVLAIGKGSSAAGLTAAAVRDDFGEGRWTLEAGALVLADNGFVAIDEMDKMDDKDTAAMHEAMEQQTVTISKAGIMATLKSRCSVLAAANPKNGRYDENEEFMSQINFPPPLVSRFDVIFRLIDKPDQKRDEELAEHVLNAHRLGEIYRSQEISNIQLETIENEEDYEPPLEREMFRKYVAYAKSHIFPRMTEDAMAFLKEEYVRTRNSGTSDGRFRAVPITARQLESTIRLAEAAAKARLSEVVTLDDAILAKNIVESYLKDVSSDRNGLDIDMLETGMSSSKRSDIERILDIIRDLKDMKKGMAPLEDDVIGEAETRGMSREDAVKAIKMGRNSSIFYSPQDKHIDKV